MLNDELVTAKAAVVSKLLVIAPYSAHGVSNPRPGVSKGERSRQVRNPNFGSGDLVHRALSSSNTLFQKLSNKLAKAVITSASFVCSGAATLNGLSAPGFLAFIERVISRTRALTAAAML